MIAIGADHGGFALKQKIIEKLQNEYEWKDYGTFSADSVDYPQIAYEVAKAVANHEVDCGILLCRTGVGMSIVANKVRGIRCALCYNEKVGKICKEDNNANIIALPADMITVEEAIRIIRNWMDSSFAGGRHARRVNMIEEIIK